MKIIFCSQVYEKNDYSKIKNAKPISGHIFQMNLIDGLTANNIDLYVINTPRISYFPKYDKIFIKSSEFEYDDKPIGKNIGFINLAGLNYYTQRRALTKELKKLMNDPEETYILVAFNSYYPQSKAILRCKKKYRNLISCDIVGDIHGKYGIRNPRKGLIGAIIGLIEKQQDELSKRFDCYVFLTQAMAEALSVVNKPYIVIEGMYNKKLISNRREYENEMADKYIFYAGSLAIEYGIEHLLRAFLKVKDEDLYLLIAGNGNGKELIEAYSKTNNRIKYLGVISPEKVKSMQTNAIALISPRQSNLEYVKYSFPSKTMECLASGKPYIAHQLPCEPDEYANYIQYPEDESDQALANEITKICGLSREQREQIGEKARQFIFERKNPEVMCKRIVNFWNLLIEG